MTFTLHQLAEEAEREVAMRVRVYAGRVAAGKMREDTAERQIRLMRAIGERLRAEADAEAAKERLI